MIQTLWAGGDEEVNVALKRWAAAQIWPGEGREFGADGAALGVFDDETLIAVVVFHDWEPKAGLIEISAAAISRRWLAKPVLWQMFSYAFNVVGCQLAVLRVSADARQAHIHRMLTAYGFDHVRIKRMYGRFEDGLVFTLTDDDWRRNGFHKEMTHG